MKNVKAKFLLSTFFALLLFVYPAKGQTAATVEHKYVEFGIRFMPTFSSLRTKTSTGSTIKGEVTLGLGIGALVGFNFNEYLGVQGEIIYSSISQKSKLLGAEYKINLRYVNIPLLFSLNTGKSKMVNLNVVAGPQIGLNVGSRLTTTGTIDENNPQPILAVKKGDLGFAFGAGVDFGLNPSHTIRLGLGYRGVLGLLDISNGNNTTTTNSYYILDRAHMKTNTIYAGLSILF